MVNKNTNIDCSVVKDLIPLYVDDLASNETKKIINSHLENCEDCSEYLSLVSYDEHIDVKLEDNDLEKSGEKIVKEIKKSQDRIKYTFIIFSMIVAVSNGWLSKGFMSTIPLIIVIPFILTLFFNETKVILITAIAINLILSIATNSLDFGLVSTPFLIVAVLSGTLLGKSLKTIKEGDK